MPTWLKKFGQIVIEGITIAAGVAPLFAVAKPSAAGTANQIASDLQQLLGVIQQTEVIGQTAGMTGAQKLAAASPIVRQQVLVFLQQAGFSVQDQNRFLAATTGLTSVLADLLNSIDAVKTAPAS